MEDFDSISLYQPKIAMYKARVEAAVQRVLDRIIPFVLPRWVFFTVMLFHFVYRVFYTDGFFIVAYGLAIYLLNLVLVFLTPAANFEDGEDTLEAPVDSLDDFRPFIRQLPEFKMWKMGSTAVSIATLMTFIDFFDIPCYWPILVMYFFFLAFLTMKQRIQHMIDHRYVPWSRKKEMYVAK